MRIEIGDVFFLKTENESVAHPYIVFEIDNDKVKVCGVTTNAKKLNMPGNFELETDFLKKGSIVDVANTKTVEISKLSESFGKVSIEIVNQIILGINFIERYGRNKINLD